VHTIKRVGTPSDQMLPGSEPRCNDGAGRTITFGRSDKVQQHRNLPEGQQTMRTDGDPLPKNLEI